MSEKPLHVQVAEALGWTETFGYPKRFDTDWAVTGPLIERFRLSLRPLDDGGYMAEHYRGGVLIVARPGDTPCLAVCWLLLALAGKFDLKEECAHPDDQG